MRCPRCKGLMAPVDLYDNCAQLSERWYSTRQCVNCSHIHFSTPRKEVHNDQERGTNAPVTAAAYAHEEGKERLLRIIMGQAFPQLQQ